MGPTSKHSRSYHLIPSSCVVLQVPIQYLPPSSRGVCESPVHGPLVGGTTSFGSGARGRLSESSLESVVDRLEWPVPSLVRTSVKVGGRTVGGSTPESLTPRLCRVDETRERLKVSVF